MKTETNALKLEVNKTGYVMVQPDMIVADENQNPRYEYGDIEELMTSIVENGIRNPLKGYEKNGKIVLKDGHRRMRAVRLAIERGKKIERVPVILEQRAMNEEERTLEYIIFNDGKPLTMLEQSEVIRRLLNFGWKVTDVVKKTGKARGYIDNLILLTKAPMKIQHHVKDGRISAHAVIQIMQAVKGDDEQAIKDVEAAIKAAADSGKEKATPKHVATKEVKNQSFGKFYKWAEELVDKMLLRKDIDKPKKEVVEKLLVYFENGRPTDELIGLYFVDKTKVKAEEPKPAVMVNKPVLTAKANPKKKAPSKTPVKPLKKSTAKTAVKPAKKSPAKKRK